MFEKESVDKITQQFGTLGEYNTRTRIWQDGAEFGYNKANKWHYPSKGEYPKECENPTSYDFSRVDYHAGRKDGVKEVLRDLRRFAQYILLHRGYFQFY